jgi:outer membrane biosynthesis protein TonB
MPVPSSIAAPALIPAQTSCPPAAIESGGEAAVPESFRQMYPSGGQARTLEQVQSIFNRSKQAFISIYNRASQEQPCLAGKVYFAIAIHADGSVANVQVVKSTVNSPSFEQKLSQRIALVRFPPVEGHGFYVLIYPMTFSGN